MQDNSPRRHGLTMELEGGTGPITAICSCGEFLEIFKADKTFRVQSPDTYDPDESNPAAPWLASPVADVGSSEPVVARVLLQASEILNAANLRGVNAEAVLLILHDCMDSLLKCQNAANRIIDHVSRIKSEFAQIAATSVVARSINPFPQVPGLGDECGAFLVHAKRAIKSACDLPREFVAVDRPDTNFNKLADRLSTVLGADADITAFVRASAAGVKHLIDLRNFHEHPRSRRTIIENFRLAPSMQVEEPAWHLTDTPPVPICADMEEAIRFLIHICETMLILLVLHRLGNNAPLCVEEIEVSEWDPAKPIRFRLGLSGRIS